MEINGDKVREEAIRYLTDLIRINTANPPGNESEAAVYLRELLNREGIKATIYAAAAGRGNLVATIKGTGRRKPLVLLSHLDVVAANPGQWTRDPFAGEVADGYVWGRGALDMKGMLVMELLALLLYHRSGLVPERDLILAAAADEEVGGHFGMEWLLKQDIPGLGEAEYVINEGGEGTVREGTPVYACQNGEKGVLWLKLTVKGTPGHASMPAKDNAILRMAEILRRIGGRKRTISLTPTTRGFLSELAKLKGLRLPENRKMSDFSLKIFAGKYFKDERSVQAMLYNTVSPTVLRAGEKTNVLPEVCEAMLDCRLLPGETPEHFFETIQKLLNDPGVTLEVMHAAAPTESPWDTALYRIIGEAVRAENPEATVTPYLSPGATDSRYFRERGITAYGFMPVIIPETELQRMHGIDERLSLENLERGVRILTEVVRKTANET